MRSKSRQQSDQIHAQYRKPHIVFRRPESADELGWSASGANLTPPWLLDAYRHGLFPWPLIHGIEEPQWWSPDPRAIFELDGFHISRRLAANLAQRKFRQ